MTITLTIDSVDSLPDGGPISYQARNRGFEIGRQQHLDWTLPDPSRYISGLHCEVRYEKGGYWLYDVSSNGTFLNGSSVRMKSPYRLEDGDRLSIGHYLVRVAIDDPSGAPRVREREPEREAPQAQPSPFASSGDIWDTGEPAPPPIDRRELMPEPANRRRAADFSEQYIAFADMKPAESPPPRDPFAEDPFAASRPAPRPQPAPAPAPFAEDPFAAPPQPMPGPRLAESAPAAAPFADMPDQAPPRLPPQRPPSFDVPVALQPPVPVASESFAQAPAASVQPMAQGFQPFPPPRQPASDAGGQGRLIEALAAAAGVPAETFSGRDPAEIGKEIGEFLRVSVENLAQLLRARAAAKAMTKSSSRTMIGAMDNNPLKFIPAPSEIIEVMFTRKRPGFLGARASLEAGFADLKRHEMATIAAMQKALGRVLDDIAPETISAKVGSSTFGSKKSRSWDLFVTRWESKTEQNENGMLDVFLGYFAEAYDEANKKG